MNNILKILNDCELNNISKKYELLIKHLNNVLEVNKKINLTAIKDEYQAKLLHIEDSIAPLYYILGLFNEILPHKVKYADIGSGAGYPGIPIGVTSSFNTTLIETTKKKADFLKNFIKNNNFENFKILNVRIENVGKNYFEEFNLITARALANLSSLLELASPLCKIGGVLICFKSIDCAEEIKEATLIENVFGFKKIEEKDYILSDKKTKRKIIVYKKINKASIKLPRKLGMAQKRPYKIK